MLFRSCRSEKCAFVCKDSAGKTRTDLATAKQLNDAIRQMEAILPQAGVVEDMKQLRDGRFLENYTQYIGEWTSALAELAPVIQSLTVSGGDAASVSIQQALQMIQDPKVRGELEKLLGAERDIERLRTDFVNNSALPFLSSTDTQVAQMIGAAVALDRWCPSLMSGEVPDEQSIKEIGRAHV